MVNMRRPETNVPPMPRVARNAMNIPYNALAHATNAALSADTAKEWAAHYVGKSPQFVYDVVTGLPNVLADGYRGIKDQMTGATPLVTGEPGRPHTDADTYQAARQSLDALGAAGMLSVAAPARAAALGARTRPASTIRAFHGTDKDFDKFDISKSKDIGIHFGNEDAAFARQTGADGFVRSGQRTIPADITMSNPLRMSDLGLWEPSQIAKEIGVLNEFSRRFRKPDRGMSPDEKANAYAYLRSKIEDRGNDGIVYKNRYENEGDADSYIAIKQGTVRSPITGNVLFSTAKQASPASIFTAYHGSPHDFDRFSMDKIGTGEGTQAYGHGLYFADNPKVAKQYQHQFDLANNTQRYFLNGKDITDAQNLDDATRTAVETIWNRGTIDGAIDHLEDLGPQRAKLGDQALEILKSGRVKIGSGANLYEVNVRANQDDFLDWDKPLSDQPPIVQQAMKPIREEIRGKVGHLMGDDIEGYLDDLSFDDVVYGREGQLKEAGIPGIKYKDQESRGSVGGTYNYVIFDENLVEIAKKNGIPVKQTERGTEISERGMQMLTGLQAAQQTPPEQTFQDYEYMDDRMKEAILAARGL